MPPLPLPRPVQPYPDELPEAWLVRLADANRCTVRVLLGHIGIKQRDVILRAWETTWLAIEEASGVGLNDFQDDRDNALSKLYGTALIRHRSRAIHICPECFKTLDYLPAWTKTKYSFVCEKHGVTLIKNCSTCRSKLTYAFNKIDVLLCCQHCLTPYSAMIAPAVPSTVSHFQRMINRSCLALSTDHAAFFELSYSNSMTPLVIHQIREGHGQGYQPEGRFHDLRRFSALGVVINGVEDIYSVSHLVFDYSTLTRKIKVPTNPYFRPLYLEEVAEKIHDSLHRHYGHRLRR